MYIKLFFLTVFKYLFFVITMIFQWLFFIIEIIIQVITFNKIKLDLSENIAEWSIKVIRKVLYKEFKISFRKQ